MYIKKFGKSVDVQLLRDSWNLAAGITAFTLILSMGVGGDGGERVKHEAGSTLKIRLT